VFGYDSTVSRAILSKFGEFFFRRFTFYYTSSTSKYYCYMMLVLLSFFVSLNIGNCVNLRSGLRSLSGVKGNSNSITTPSMGSPSAPDTYSGVGFDAGSGQFNLDIGATANMLNSLPAPNQLVVGKNGADFGMRSSQFNPPAVSYTVPLNGWSPPAYNVVGCSPSTYSALLCSRAQMSNYNLGVGNLYSATSMPRR
jgi:hypothetical protein